MTGALAAHIRVVILGEGVEVDRPIDRIAEWSPQFLYVHVQIQSYKDKQAITWQRGMKNN
jgi:hypothetical protein